MLLGADPAPLLTTGDPAVLVAHQVLAEHADRLLDEQHERLASHIAAKVAQLFG
jgi:hypothetical protein